MAPISSSSLSIGTTMCERAPASRAERGFLSSAAASRVWTSFFVRNIPVEGSSGRRAKRFTQQSVDKGRWRTDHGLHDKRAVPINVQHAELCLADAKCILQHGLKYRLKPARRTANDLQHLGGRLLLLQRLGELLFQVGVGCAKAVNVSSRLRCLRTKTGNASSAFRPFASQGHLVGTVTGPPCGRPSQGSSLS